MNRPCVVACATFTAEPLAPYLAFWLDQLKLELDVAFAPYDQVFQTLLDAGSLFETNRGGVNVILLNRELDGIEEAIRGYTAPAPLVVVLCPGASQALPVDVSAKVRVIRASGIAAQYPVSEIFDPHAEREGRIPYTTEFFAALATAVSREIHLLKREPHKVIAVDCDNTLWAGVCGEDGPEGVRLDAGRRDFHQFLLRQRERGKLLVIASKNNEEDVWETFQAHPEFPLRKDHFVSWRINWDAKADNLRSLAAELSLGLDSFIFLDDDQRECQQMRESAPAVAVVQMPHEGQICELLDHVWAFDQLQVTDEDRARNEYYAASTARSRVERESTSFQDFLAKLDLTVDIRPLKDAALPRAAQLTQRTNQLNSSTIRRTEAELESDLRNGTVEGWTVSVRDRFGDYGLVGLMLLRSDLAPRNNAWIEVETFLLSCRALGRGVEHRMLAHVGALARLRGIPGVQVRFSSTRKNKPAKLFLDSINPAVQTPEGSYQFDAGLLAALEYKPQAVPAPVIEDPSNAPTAANGAGLTKPDYMAIAGLRSPHDLVERMRGASELHPELAFAPELERDLARVWSELLNGAAVGRNDDFFEIGGHSLLAVQLLSRIRREFGADLTLDVMYGGPMTVRSLAEKIELARLGIDALDEADYAALVSEIEQLSDEEARVILAAEEVRGIA